MEVKQLQNDGLSGHYILICTCGYLKCTRNVYFSKNIFFKSSPTYPILVQPLKPIQESIVFGFTDWTEFIYSKLEQYWTGRTNLCIINSIFFSKLITSTGGKRMKCALSFKRTEQQAVSFLCTINNGEMNRHCIMGDSFATNIKFSSPIF